MVCSCLAVVEELCHQAEELQEEFVRLCSISKSERRIDSVFLKAFDMVLHNIFVLNQTDTGFMDVLSNG